MLAVPSPNSDDHPLHSFLFSFPCAGFSFLPLFSSSLSISSRWPPHQILATSRLATYHYATLTSTSLISPLISLLLPNLTSTPGFAPPNPRACSPILGKCRSILSLIVCFGAQFGELYIVMAPKNKGRLLQSFLILSSPMCFEGHHQFHREVTVLNLNFHMLLIGMVLYLKMMCNVRVMMLWFLARFLSQSILCWLLKSLHLWDDTSHLFIVFGWTTYVNLPFPVYDKFVWEFFSSFWNWRVTEVQRLTLLYSLSIRRYNSWTEPDSF